MQIIQNYWLEALSIGITYGVNPVIFASIYIGAIPLFTLSIAWLVARYRKDQSIVIPAITSSGLFLSAYIYAILFGKNLPWWFYIVVFTWILIGGYFTYRSTQQKLRLA